MERIDTLLNGNKIFQDTDSFLYGIDAVLLADFTARCCKKNDFVVDLCSGNGIVPLLLEHKISAGKIVGVEIQKNSALLAQKSMELNYLQEKISFLNGDLKEINKNLKKHCANIVSCNPPYMIFNHGRLNPSDAKTIARHEISCTLEDVVVCADYLLKPKGSFCMIHRPFRLPEIFLCLNKHHLEPKRMQLILPFEGREPNLVLVEARKNASPSLKIEPPVAVRNKYGKYTEEILRIQKTGLGAEPQENGGW